ncbi:MAG: glycosyltransferase [Bacillota bacterium]
MSRPGDGSAVFRSIPPPDAWDVLLRATIVVGLALLLYLCISGRAFAVLLATADRHGLSALLVKPSVMWLSMGTALLAFRTLLWFRYRPQPMVSMRDAPSMTVVIPAYNEGPMVGRSIDSVIAARYPADRLEVIVVDDGSTDDTWRHIAHAVARHGDRVTALRLAANRGKREALAAAFRQAKGEILVTLDSDSVIETNALLALAGPFRDARVGAVAGRVVVYNRSEGIIPRMLHVRFVLAFDFLRAYQSVCRTVYCTPGALSAYRAQAVERVLDAWLRQRFFTIPSTYGEDRALTNFILDLGFDTVYQRSASVSTIVPTTYGKLCRMYIRWERSFIREELRLARIAWKRPPASRLFVLVDSTITNLRYPVMYLALGLLCVAVIDDPSSLLRLLFAIGTTSVLYSLYFLRSERSSGILYGILYSYFAFFTLFWIFPFALATVRARGWLTR